MATQTQHFNLTKPDWEDRASISVLNANTDIIDAQMYDNEQSAANAIGNMAAEYDDTATYAVGDFCIYSEVLYKCVTAVTVAEAFDSTKWTQTKAAENFGSGGGGGSATLAGLNDVNLTSPTDGQALVYDAANQEWVNGSGGGGNANERVLTTAEYNALTEAQKMDGTTYYINDAVPEGKEIQPVIYSTEEREIGVWTDGKPLYQKTYIGTYTGILNGATLFSIAGLDVETMASIKGTFSYGTSNNLTAGYVSLRWDASNVIGSTSYTQASQTWAYKVTIQYIKTTDTAGSGVWTTSGVPAVHYSTDEHIVGTWIDGSPIYEKTYELSSTQAIQGGTWTNTIIPTTGMSLLLAVEAASNVGTCYSGFCGNIDTSYVQILHYRYCEIDNITIRYTKTTD